MQFRWAALIAVWTLIAGPLFGPPAAPKAARQASATVSAEQPARTVALRR